MAIVHSFVSPIADGTVTSVVQPKDWNAAHTIEVSTVAPAMLDRVYSVPADLDAYQLSSQISSAAFRASSYFAVSTHVHSASDITSSTFAVERLGSGAAASSNFLRGDRTWAVPAAGAAVWGDITGTVSNQTDLGTVVTTQSANWALSSVVTVHVAAADPHVQYQLTSLISSAAFRTSTYFAISSVVTTHIAQTDPHIQYQLSSLISSAAFRISSYFAISSHASSHQAGGSAPLNITSLPGFPGGTANFLRADSTFAAPGGGSDPWTYLKVSTSHFSVSNVAVRSITGLSFVPGANSSYEFEGTLALRTQSTSINPLVSISWPTGTTTGVGWINSGQSATGQIMAFGSTASTHVKTAGGSLPNSTTPWPTILGGFFRMGSSPGSTFSLTLASETSSTIFVSSLIGSYLKYRTI